MTDYATQPSAGGPAEQIAATSLSYWQLVRRRFRRNAYGMTGLVFCIFVIFVTVDFDGQANSTFWQLQQFKDKNKQKSMHKLTS